MSGILYTVPWNMATSSSPSAVTLIEYVASRLVRETSVASAYRTSVWGAWMYEMFALMAELKR